MLGGMWKLVFLFAAFSVAVSPLDARDAQRERVDKREPADLRRDVERISKEIYSARSAPERGSFAAGRALKKR
jgi:hypothetical protein